MFIFFPLFLCSSPNIKEIAQQRLQADSYVHALWFYKTIITSYPKVFIRANASGSWLREKSLIAAKLIQEKKKEENILQLLMACT